MGDVITMAGKLEPRGSWEATHCTIAKALDVVSTRTAMLILREAFYGTTRFDDFVTRVGVTEAVASARLRELVAAGLLTREPYKEPGQRTRHQYRLTEMGADFFPAVVAFMQWGERWVSPGVVELRHIACGAPVTARVTCANGHDVDAGDLELAVKSKSQLNARP